MKLEIIDSQLLEELSRYGDSEETLQEVALTAMRLGLNAMRMARGEIDMQRLQQVSENMLGIIENRVTQIIEKHSVAILQEFSLDYPNSAIQRLNGNLNKHYESVQVALTSATTRRNEHRVSTQGGYTYEKEVGNVLSTLVNHAQDWLDATGDFPGAILNSKVGDYVITLGDSHYAKNMRIVVEAKRNQSYSLRDIINECKTACSNRDAQIALFVWDYAIGEAKHQPPLARVDNFVIVLWDAEKPETDIYLQAGYWLARSLVVISETAKQDYTVEHEVINDSFRQISECIQAFAPISKSADIISKEASKLKQQSEDMKRKIEVQIERLEKQISGLLSS